MGSQGAALLLLQPVQQQQQQQRGVAGNIASRSSNHTYSSGSSGSSGRQQLVAHHIPAAAAASVVNLSGAGDTLTGGFAAALLQGASPQHALAVGVAAAKLAVEFHLNVPGPQQGMQFDAVEQQAQQLLAKLQVWQFPVGCPL